MRKVAVLTIILSLIAAAALADDWARFLGPRGDGVWREDNILEEFPDGGLKYRWKKDIGPGYSSPAITNGRVYITDRLLKGDGTDQERLLCLNEKDGETIWTVEWPAAYKSLAYATGPRAMPLVHDGRVYVLGSMGRLTCVDEKSGEEIWSKHYVDDFGGKVPTWGFAAQPLLLGDKLICVTGGDDGAVVALNAKTGALEWRSLPTPHAGYCQPFLYKDIRLIGALIVWHPSAISSVDPYEGKVHWTIPWEIGMGMSISRPAAEGARMAFSAQASGATMLQFKPLMIQRPDILWQHSDGARGRRTDQSKGINTVIGTLILRDNHLYGVSTFGEFLCLKTETGEQVWMTYQPTNPDPSKRRKWCNLFITPHADRYFLFNEFGELIIAKLSPEGYKEIDRTQLIEPDSPANGRLGNSRRLVVWSHPSYANQSVYVRNDSQLVCADLKAPDGQGVNHLPRIHSIYYGIGLRADRIIGADGTVWGCHLSGDMDKPVEHDEAERIAWSKRQKIWEAARALIPRTPAERRKTLPLQHSQGNNRERPIKLEIRFDDGTCRFFDWPIGGSCPDPDAARLAELMEALNTGSW